ncbi:lysophospholipid acyltransferase family protein [Sphingomonas canadensis]|uniref:Lysophospholipid acyltransferase family protein n=1 Tax=Sphingomonas canadensis TaxID=1219257 RepID=A0ABW3H1A1_9SPHN|nr:lysophospholipid acyltransferase family protein [Sphingomonas canadensis]MCW3834860.1 1-acyl-sn-glycerol-3-phosphate acyltransferase [Sphingomonas canadensis]
MINWLRTIAFSAFFYTLSVPIVLLAPVAALFGRGPMRAYCNAWAGTLRWSARIFLGIRVECEGEVPEGPVLFAAKHESIFEALELTRLLRAPATVMKRELTQIPVWGWSARRYGVIVVDRKASAKAMRSMMRDAKAALAEGRSVMIFPEGTRVAPGEAPWLQSGFAGLYRMLGLPVVPVAVKSGHVWPKGGAKRPGVITFHFGDAIPPGLPRDEAEALVHKGINALQPEALAKG